MEGVEAIGRRKSFSAAADFERTSRLKERLERLLREAAAVEVELSRSDGTIEGVPHYSQIEGRAHALGKQFSREVQQRQMSERAASQAATAKRPGCGTMVRLQARQRGVKSVDGDSGCRTAGKGKSHECSMNCGPGKTSSASRHPTRRIPTPARSRQGP